MRKLTLNELKETQICILTHVADFCEQNEIQYWIDSGTLLGAIRHKGYIPWDDDIDIGMLRADYDKFSKLFNSSDSQYRFVCLENTPKFYLPHGKVCDMNTILYEPDENGEKLAVNIDIFVYDNAPDDEVELKKMYDKRDFWRKIYWMQNNYIDKNGNIVKVILKYLRRAIYRLRYKNRNPVEEMIQNSKKYMMSQTKRVGNFTAFTRMSCDKSVFSSFIDVEFEGKKYKAPVGYDEWLRSFYGDYMKLPPEEKRISHHKFVAYTINDMNEEVRL